MGANQMGKSQLMRLHYFKWAKANPDGYVELIGKRGGYWIEGSDLAPRKGAPGWEQLYPRILELTNNGLGPSKNPKKNPRVGLAGGIVRFEDADNFIPNPIRGTPYGTLFTENAHCYLDVLCNFHRPEPMDKNLLGCAHHWYMFSMQEVHAFEYSLDLIRVSFVMVGGVKVSVSNMTKWELWPSSKGVYIHVVNDPDKPGHAKATLFNDYDPVLDSTRNQGG